MTAVEVRTFRAWDALAPLAGEWNALAGESEFASVFQTYEWHDAWWRNFGHEQQLVVICAFSDGRLQAIAPLMIGEGILQRRSRRILRFIGTSNFASDYANFIVAAGPQRDRIIGALVSEAAEEEGWDVAELARVPTQTPWLRTMHRELRRTFPIVRDRIETEAPSRLLSDPVADREVVNTKIIRRRVNFFEKQKPLRFEHLSTPADQQKVLDSLDDFFAQHIARRAMLGDQSQFHDERQRQFYRDLVPRMLNRGWLRFAILHWGDVVLAYHFGFEYANRFVFYKPTLNVEWMKQSPGKVLIKLMMEEAIERGLDEFDFTVGEEAYKYEIANIIRTNTRFYAFRSRLDGSAFTLIERVKPMIRNVIKAGRAVRRSGKDGG